jgi:hypothetical protein
MKFIKIGRQVGGQARDILNYINYMVHSRITDFILTALAISL